MRAARRSLLDLLQASGRQIDGEHIVVANDNNLPYSAGRKPNVQDDNELILLRVPELLRAR